MDLEALKSLDINALKHLDASELLMPWDDNPAVEGPEVDVGRQLAGDLAHVRRPTRRRLVDFRANPEAFRHLARLPERGESLHGVISGRYALWDLVPAILERTGRRIRELYIATLGFSRSNAAELLDLLDAKRVGRVSLLVSHYFKGTSRPIYDSLVPHLLERSQRVLAFRTHCKMLLVDVAGGPKFVCESSANLRSCKNVEQFVLSADAKLYGFHRRWIDEVIDRGQQGDD